LTAVLLLARLFLAGLFLYAGLVKAGASEQFAVTIAQFTILPPTFVGWAAALLPFLEITAAVLLVLPATARYGTWLIATLLTIFILSIGWALSQGLIVDCGCFGESTPSHTKMLLALVRDVGLLILTVGLAVRQVPERTPRN